MHAPYQDPRETPTDLPMARPSSRSDLFLSFTFLALQGFGGVLAIVQHELVERKRWMTQETFTEEWAVAQIMPGPNVINLALMIGGRYFGLTGALCALAGMLVIPLILVLFLAVLYARVAMHPGIVDALRGMSAVSAGLIAATALKMLRSLRYSSLPRSAASIICAAGFASVALLKLPLIWVLLGLGIPACVLSYYRLAVIGSSTVSSSKADV